MTKKIRRKRQRRRKRQPRKAHMVKEATRATNVKKVHARVALVARLPGGAFREFLVQQIPGYCCLENTLLDEYVKTIGKWEGWLFFYLGVIYILKNFTSYTQKNPLVAASTVPSGLIASSLI